VSALASALSDKPAIDKVVPAPSATISERCIMFLAIEGFESLFPCFRIEAEEITNIKYEHSIIPPLQ
jgi:hypothetical protein